MFEILQVTAQYSNAVLVAILPHVSDFATKLDLPIPKPITAAHVQQFKCSWRSDVVGGLVILTNGYEFGFRHGIVSQFRSPKCYYALQNPDLIPSYFGEVKLKESDAVALAKKKITTLGYDKAALNLNEKPEIVSPTRIGENYVARYLITWKDKRGRDPNSPSVRVEVDASNKQLHMLSLHSQGVFKPEIKVDVKPRVLSSSAANTAFRGGRRILPVSGTYSNAFLAAILPQLNDYVKKSGVETKLPITTNNVDMSRYICGLVDNDPMVSIDLKTGQRFVYRHGQVIAFYANDVAQLPGEEQRPETDFLGTIKMSKDEAIALVQKTIAQLGYSVKALHLDKPPRFSQPKDKGAKSFTRFFLNWMDATGEEFFVVAEIDANRRKLKSLYVNDHAITSIWREPPDVGAPIEDEPVTR